MPLDRSERLGPYEILAPAGAGGMGEVYKARDTRLNRTVAIKILPGGVDADPMLSQWFRREAQALAALNHPNICTEHDVGVEPRHLVMEYLHGETLAVRLSRGPLPMAERPWITAPPSPMPWIRRTGPGSSTGTSSHRTLS